MYPRTLVLWLIPSLCLAYNPPVFEILSRMETALRKPDPLVVDIIRETPDGSVLHEGFIRIPAESPEETAVQEEFALPFSLLTLPKDDVLEVFSSLSDNNASVSLDRYEGSVCYLLEGASQRLWLRKKDLVPLRAESLKGSGEWTVYLYFDLTSLSNDLFYPARTEVQRSGSLLMVERLIPAVAATDQP